MLRWGLECTNSRIVLEGKEVVLILSLFKLFVMLWEEEMFGKVMYPSGELVLSDTEWALVCDLILIMDFEGFRFSKIYKRFGVLKVKEGVFYVVEFII